MKILIIEDDQFKARQLYDYIKSKSPDSLICEKSAFQNGMDAIVNDTFQLLLLDMSMPSFDLNHSKSSGRYRHYGGRDILEEMKRKKINIPTVIVTQFTIFGEGEDQMDWKQLDVLLNEEFPEMYIGLVLYNASSPEWKRSLANKIDDYFQE